MEEYTFTDEPTVSRIAEEQPRALSAYFICLHNADENGHVVFSKEFIINHVVKSWTKFKNDIRALARLFLLNFNDMGTQIEIELIPQGIASERCML